MGNPFRTIKGGQTVVPRIPMVAVDRFGKPIEEGHLILFHAGQDLVFEVVDVGPVLNPSVAGGQAIQVRLRAEFPVQFLPASPNRDMVIVGESQARIAKRAGSNGQPESAAPVSPVAASGIVLTDPDATHNGLPGGICGKCGDEGELGKTCTECGCDTYQAEKPTLGDA